MTDHLKATLTASGCTFVVYESEQQADRAIDGCGPDDVIGVVKEAETMTLRTGGNGINKVFPLTNIEILKQVKPEDTAENNKATFEAMADVASAFVLALIRSKLYQKITDVNATKVNERRYDANVLGWSLAINLQPITNRMTCVDLVVINVALICAALAAASCDICAAVQDKFA